MTEEERINKINTAAVKHLEDILLQLENEEIAGDDLLAVSYAYLIASVVAGYNPESFVNDAITAAHKLMDLVEEPEDASE
jgi:spermidine/putrescine-binding protein